MALNSERYMQQLRNYIEDNRFRVWSSILLNWVLLIGSAVGEPWVPADISPDRPFKGFVGPQACVECHADIAAKHSKTAHALASMVANEETILGSFDAGRNRLSTVFPGYDLLMEKSDVGLRQSLVYEAPERIVRVRSGEFAIVLGLVKGQTYLYWRDDLLCQLPASYAKSADEWAYSPGFPEGRPYFDRVIEPGCMDCHATVFETVLPDKIVKTDKAILGVTCESCHGPGEAHVRHHQRYPESSAAVHMAAFSSLSREQRVEACGYCHSGIKPDTHKRPAFSFRPGDRLDDYFERKRDDFQATPEVHGNQMGLLQQSRCYQESQELVCTSCHDPHARQRGRLADFAARCIACHTDLDKHAEVRPGADLVADCVDCHMPLIDSKLIDVKQGGVRHSFAVRSHRITIY